VMFPIHNLAGRVIAFGGRVLKTAADTAKYLNSPESEIYHKSHIVYGIFHAKREITRLDKCYLVEGYTDVLAMHQSGIENVVASSGTSLTTEQIRLIKRFTPNVTIIYDGDQAGIKASLRGIDLVLEEGLNVKVLLLPDGEDPDSFSRSRNATELAEFIKANETDFIHFKTKLLLKETENDPVAKARLITDIIRSVAVIPENITRSVYLKECSRLLNVDEQVLYAEVRKLKRKQTDDKQMASVREKPQKVARQPEVIPRTEEILIEEMELLRFLLKYWNSQLFEMEDEHHQPKIITGGEYIIGEMENEGLMQEDSLFSFVLNEVKKNLGNPEFEAYKYFVNHPDMKVARLASDLLTEKHVESKRWHRAGSYAEKEEEILDILIPRVVNEYKLRIVRNLLQKIGAEIDAASKENDFDKVIEKQSTYMNLKKVEKVLSDKLGNRAIN
jgi:DNA primase